LTRTNYWGQAAEMDNQGRLLLPQLLRDSAQLKGEVAVMGYLNRLEVQSMEAVRKEVEEGFTAEDEKNLDDLGI
jgi:MraZ protein